MKRLVFEPAQFRVLVPRLVESPFRNYLTYGIFAMLETVIELGTDTSYGHIEKVFKHKVGIC